MGAHLPVIVIEVVLVFGGVLLFAAWQFRDLARERRKREQARREAAELAGLSERPGAAADPGTGEAADREGPTSSSR